MNGPQTNIVPSIAQEAITALSDSHFTQLTPGFVGQVPRFKQGHRGKEGN